MAIPFHKEIRIGGYLLKQKLLGRKRYPLVLMLEPLFRCNLACAGCGKIQHPAEVLRKQLTPEECFQAADECGAPIVAIAGGEPFLIERFGAVGSRERRGAGRARAVDRRGLEFGKFRLLVLERWQFTAHRGSRGGAESRAAGRGSRNPAARGRPRQDLSYRLTVFFFFSKSK